jgi:cytochrome c oxidase cbb3-type subunit 4
VIWAYSSKRKKQFDEAANLPFEDEELHKKTQAGTGEDKQ